MFLKLNVLVFLVIALFAFCSSNGKNNFINFPLKVQSYPVQMSLPEREGFPTTCRASGTISFPIQWKVELHHSLSSFIEAILCFINVSSG